MIHVIATIKAIDNKRDALVAEFQEILPRIRAKTSCAKYTIATHCMSGLPGQNSFDKNEIILIEEWTDLNALKTHIMEPAYRAWFIKISPLIARASMEIFEIIS